MAEQEQPGGDSSYKEKWDAAHWIYLSSVQRVHAQVKAVAELLVRFLLRVLHTPRRSRRGASGACEANSISNEEPCGLPGRQKSSFPK